MMFSDRAVVAPYRGLTAFMFRITNARSNQLVELEAKVLFSHIEGASRKYDQLTLERTRVVFFPLSWTIVHPIDEKSPMFGMTARTISSAKDAGVHDSPRGHGRDVLADGARALVVQAARGRVGHRFVNIYNPIDDGRRREHRRPQAERDRAAPEDDWAAHVDLASHRTFRRLLADSPRKQRTVTVARTPG